MCVASAFPVNVGALTVPAGVPALTACDNATGADVVSGIVTTLLIAAREVPVPNVAGSVNSVSTLLGVCIGSSCWCVAKADPVNVGAEFVPEGVPALTAVVVPPAAAVPVYPALLNLRY